MSPDIVKNLIRKGRSNTVFFVESLTSPSELNAYINLLKEAQSGHIIIGVKECGTVIGLRKTEKELHKIAVEACKETTLEVHLVPLITEFKVIVISYSN